MAHLAWLTDIHLNFLPAAKLAQFLAETRAVKPDAWLIGGDIAEAPDLIEYLESLVELPGPVYFVLGNHDYYYGSISSVRRQVHDFCGSHPQFVYLSRESAPIEVAPGVGLVGHDGWADGRSGDYEHSLVSMTDFRVIDDFVGLSKAARWPKLKALGDEAADHIRRSLAEATMRFRRVILLTHVPPLREACWHEGRLSDDQWAPYFVCRAVGDTILEIMRDKPNVQLTVLCGHTHGSGTCKPLANVEILTGGADYGSPRIQQVFEFGSSNS